LPRNSVEPIRSYSTRNLHNADSAKRRRELSQNFFRKAHDMRVFASQIASPPDTQIVEIGAGSGQITQAIVDLQYSVLALEIDAAWAESLKKLALPRVRVLEIDALNWTPPDKELVLVGNLPFSVGTRILRHVLSFGPQVVQEAVFLLQKEYVAKRVGHWGGNLFNAQWSPWFRFKQGASFPCTAFRPVPRSDATTLIVKTHESISLPWSERVDYQRLWTRIYTTGQSSIGDAASVALGGKAQAIICRSRVSSSKRVKMLERIECEEIYRAWREGESIRAARSSNSTTDSPGSTGRPRRQRRS